MCTGNYSNILPQVGFSNSSRGGAYSSNCGTGQWTTKAWPCGKDVNGKFYSYHGRYGSV